MSINSKASLFDLYPEDRAAIARIRKYLELHSNALAVRIAIRQLAKRLQEVDQTKPVPQEGRND